VFEKLTSTMHSYLEYGLPGCFCVVLKDGQQVFKYAAGYSDRENKIPMTGNEICYVYSCSKLITCVAAMQLWEKGLFSLEDKLSDYMPEFSQMSVKTEDGIRAAQKPILIKHLFEMSAGFSYSTTSAEILKCRKETEGRCPTREVMKYLAKEPLLFEPGERWEYSLCHDVLAALVEVIAGVRFGEYVKKNIFDVLGMDHSTFSLPEEKLHTVCPQYRYQAETKTVENVGKNIVDYKLGSEFESGGAGCISTLDDYLKFIEALREGEKLLKRETIALMATDRLTDSQRSTYWFAETHGYGLGVRCPKAGGKYTDFGWSGAAGAYYAIDLKYNFTIYYGQHMLLSPYDNAETYVAAWEDIKNAET